jgi:hypothetical protein
MLPNAGARQGVVGEIGADPNEEMRSQSLTDRIGSRGMACRMCFRTQLESCRSSTVELVQNVAGLFR